MPKELAAGAAAPRHATRFTSGSCDDEPFHDWTSTDGKPLVVRTAPSAQYRTLMFGIPGRVGAVIAPPTHLPRSTRPLASIESRLKFVGRVKVAMRELTDAS